MKLKKATAIGVLLASACAMPEAITAQVPYFGPTIGEGKVYAYSSLKVRPGANMQETYSNFLYGVTSTFDVGFDIHTAPDNSAAWGAILRCGWDVSTWFQIGFQATPQLNLNDHLKFHNLSTAMYVNGAFSSDKKWIWTSNTFYTVYPHNTYALDQVTYVGMNIKLGEGRSLTPMAGAMNSWRFHSDVQPALGAYYTFGKYNLYVWGNDFLHAHPRLVVGADLCF